MILVDANLLVYAFVKSSVPHLAARRWLETVLSDSPRVGLPWASLLAFVRLTTNPRMYDHPSTIEDSWSQVEEWLSLDNVWIPQPKATHPTILGRLLRESVHKSDLVSDAHLAALAIEHGLTLASTDGDFAGFRGLRWVNPLGDGSRAS